MQMRCTVYSIVVSGWQKPVSQIQHNQNKGTKNVQPVQQGAGFVGRGNALILVDEEILRQKIGRIGAGHGLIDKEASQQGGVGPQRGNQLRPGASLDTNK